LGFSLYPNPTEGDFTIKIPGIREIDVIRVIVFNIWGERILSKTIVGEAKNDISLFDFPSGIYFVKINVGNAFSTGLVVKQ
jgi:hypothetical protein